MLTLYRVVCHADTSSYPAQYEHLSAMRHSTLEDQRGVASLRNRNRAEITFRRCAGAKAILYRVNTTLDKKLCPGHDTSLHPDV